MSRTVNFLTVTVHRYTQLHINRSSRTIHTSRSQLLQDHTNTTINIHYGAKAMADCSSTLKRVNDDDTVNSESPKKARLSIDPAPFPLHGSGHPPSATDTAGAASEGVNVEGEAPGKKRAHFSKRQESMGYAGGRKKEKGGSKTGRRSRRGTRNSEVGEEKASDDVQDGPKAPRLPKRQCALLIGFCGSSYSGMQIQPSHTRTIEGVLFQAMVRAGAVSQDNADDPVKIGLARAARTDAGVHAAGNLVSLKMITAVPEVPDIIARINEELPAEIRLWGYVRVQNSFNARLVCDSRKYTYFFPTYLLIPPKPGSGLDRSLRQHATTLSPEPQVSGASGGMHSNSFWSGTESLSREADLAKKRAWRVDQGQLERLRATARKFEGTHNFHNFTVARDFSDRSNQRHMKKIEVADPVVYGETEWISVLFHGQSFMLHQRKMMTALVLTCRTATPEQLIDELYGPRVVFIPKMPSLGLLLEEPIFDSYNTRMSVINEKLQPSDPDYRPPISFDAHRGSINAFKQKFIYGNMREIEDRDGLFDAWIRVVDSYAGNDLLYLNPKGTIPTAAIIKKGERRENPFRERKKFDATAFSVDEGEPVSQDEEDEDEAPVNKRNLADTEG